MKPDDRRRFLKKMHRDIGGIEDQVVRLHHLRAVFRRLVETFEGSPELRTKWTPLHTFIFAGYTAQACLSIRRLMDKGSHKQSFSLANVVDRLAEHPTLITRKDYVARWSDRRVRLPDNTPCDVAARATETLAEEIQSLASKEFDRFACPTENSISAKRLMVRFSDVKAKCDRVLTYVDKRLAHYDREKPADPTWGDLDDAIDAVGELFKHISLLVTGSALDDLVPTWQGDPWEDILTEPWIAEKSTQDD